MNEQSAQRDGGRFNRKRYEEIIGLGGELRICTISLYNKTQVVWIWVQGQMLGPNLGYKIHKCAILLMILVSCKASCRCFLILCSFFFCMFRSVGFSFSTSPPLFYISFFLSVFLSFSLSLNISFLFAILPFLSSLRLNIFGHFLPAPLNWWRKNARAWRGSERGKLEAPEESASTENQ